MEEEHSHNKKHVRWDEEKLKETEKFRGTFEKIDEPKTPYRKNEEVDLKSCRATKMRFSLSSKVRKKSHWRSLSIRPR